MNDGGPAFPRASSEYAARGQQDGMSLRVWIATMAMQGMLSADGNDPRWSGKDTGPEYQRGGGKWLDPQGLARQSFEIADAMIKQAGKLN